MQDKRMFIKSLEIHNFIEGGRQSHCQFTFLESMADRHSSNEKQEIPEEKLDFRNS